MDNGLLVHTVDRRKLWTNLVGRGNDRRVALFRTKADPVPEVRASCTPTATTTGYGALATISTWAVDRSRAMRIPALARARDLLCETVASAEIRAYTTVWNGTDLEEMPLPPEAWMLRPNPRTTLAHHLSWTVDNLMFYGFAAWWILGRRAVDGRPAGFVCLDSAQVTITADSGTWANGVPVGDYTVTYNGQVLPRRDVILFWSPLSPVLESGARATMIAERLDQAALRFASTPTAFGWLETTGEPMTADELADLASSWVQAREIGSVGALSENVTYKESTMDPSRLQLVEARTAMATDMARVGGVSAYLISAPTGSGMTYQNAEQASAQLWRDAEPYARVIAQTLSGDEITPRGNVVRLVHDRPHANPTTTPDQSPAMTQDVTV